MGAAPSPGPSDELLDRAMALALDEAQLAFEADEVPVGAAIFAPGGELLAQAHNEILSRVDPTAHAECLALRAAAKRVGAPRLPRGTLLVSTLEPCAMCAGAVVLARVDWLLFGALDPKTGACGSLRDIVQDPRLNHRCTVLPRRQEEHCAGLLTGFFRGKR
ncbi:MAG: tRNA(adenine34) deaminase [Pseudohongiellaceae bacterium]|jgi:tRNA(adenine34) deaminase